MPGHLYAPGQGKHKPRWDALAAEGWEFRRPPPVAGMTGIEMDGGRIIDKLGRRLIVYVDAEQPALTIHVLLLEQCEHFAGFDSRPELMGENR